MKFRKVYVGDIEVDFECLRAGDKCLLVDSGHGHFLIDVKSSPYITTSGALGVDCDVISTQTKTPH